MKTQASLTSPKRPVAAAQRFRQNSLCLFVPWWFTIFHHGDTKAQRDTEVFTDKKNTATR